MRGAMRRLWELYHTPAGLKLFRYTMVSVISTLVSQGTLFLVFGILRLWSAVPSNIFANAVATVPSYYLNRNWAWGKSGRSHLMREVVPFWALSFAGMGLSIVTVGVAAHWCQSEHFGHMVTSIFVNGANLLAFAILWVIKFLIFNRLFHVEPTVLGLDPVELALSHLTAPSMSEAAGSAAPGAAAEATVEGAARGSVAGFGYAGPVVGIDSALARAVPAEGESPDPGAEPEFLDA